MHYIVVVRTDHTTDHEMGHYLANVGETLKPFEGRLLAFGVPERLEGRVDYTKVALLEFPSEAAARGWYASPAYQELAAWRMATMGHPVDFNLIAGVPAGPEAGGEQP